MQMSDPGDPCKSLCIPYAICQLASRDPWDTVSLSPEWVCVAWADGTRQGRFFPDGTGFTFPDSDNLPFEAQFYEYSQENLPLKESPLHGNEPH